MICPHCNRTIREEDQYLMARRVPKDEPLPEGMRKLGVAGLVLIAALILAFLLSVAHAHGVPV